MLTFARFFRTTLLLIFTITYIFSSAQTFTPPPVRQENWVKEYAPFRIAGNLYYVGSYDLACYLITTPNGHILINTGVYGSDTMIRLHTEALGFKFSDIKIILATHAHHDHTGGIAAIKKATGARLMINELDAPVMADGGKSDFLFGAARGVTFVPVKPDRILHEHDTVKFGGMQLAVLHHPGHTKGACSFLFDVKDNNKTYRVLIANMPSVLEETKFVDPPSYPGNAKDYAYTLDELKKLQFDLWLASHASQFGLHTKRKPGDPYRPEAFIDRAGYDSAVEGYRRDYLKRLNGN